MNYGCFGCYPYYKAPYYKFPFAKPLYGQAFGVYPPSVPGAGAYFFR